MLAPASQTRIIAQSQSRPLRENFLLASMVIGMMIVGAGFLYLVTECCCGWKDTSRTLLASIGG